MDLGAVDGGVADEFGRGFGFGVVVRFGVGVDDFVFRIALAVGVAGDFVQRCPTLLGEGFVGGERAGAGGADGGRIGEVGAIVVERGLIGLLCQWLKGRHEADFGGQRRDVRLFLRHRGRIVAGVCFRMMTIGGFFGGRLEWP